MRPPGYAVENNIRRDILHSRNLLSNPVEYAWVMSRWAWMIYNDKLTAETGRKGGNWDFWTYGTIDKKKDDLKKSGFRLMDEVELLPVDRSQRYIGTAYVYHVDGSFRHWSSHLNGKIGVISMSGTEPTNLADWWSDVTSLWCEELKFSGNKYNPDTGSTWKAGYGFAKRFESIKWILDNVLERFWHQDINDIYITGHSLGGALASIVAAYIRHGFHIFNWNPTVNLVTFGAPRTFCVSDAIELQKQSNENDDGTFTTMRIVNFNDIVTNVPSQVVNGLMHFGKVYTLDIGGNLGLLDPQEQDYQAHHYGADFLGLLNWYITVEVPVLTIARWAWGARFSHNEYPAILDALHCKDSTACSGRRTTALALEPSECAFASKPVALPDSCAMAGKLTRDTVDPNNLSTPPGQALKEKVIFVANNRVCDGDGVVDDTYYPYDCADAILKNPSLCSSGFFAVAPGSAQSCKCCKAPDVVEYQESNLWKIYKVNVD